MRKFSRLFRLPLTWTIGTKLSLTLFVVVYGVTLAIGWYAIRKQEAVMEEQLLRQGRITAEHLARVSLDPLLREDIWELYKLSRDIGRGGPPMLYAMVLNMKGELLAHSHPDGYSIAARNPRDPLLDDTLRADRTSIFPLPAGGMGYEVVAPVVLGGKKIGVVRAGISKESLERVLQRAKRELLLIAGLLALSGFSLGLVISRRIARPLRELTRSVEELSRGGFQREVSVRTVEKDEIGRLAESFDKMVRNLGEKVGEIQQTKQYLEDLLENANDFICTLDGEGGITYVNRKFEELGYRRDDLVGRPLDALLLKGSGEDDHASEVEIRDARGRRAILVMSTSPLKDNGGRVVGTLGIGKDITERKELEQRLITSERLASIGELAGAMAHEIRNPLGSIYTAANLLTYDQGVTINADHLALLRVVKHEARRLNRLLTDFLRFARPRPPNLVSCNVNALAEETLEALRYDEAAKGKEIRRALNPLVPSLLVDADQIKQALWNIALNALQAMDDGGTLSLSTSSSDGKVLITVEDTGRGIPREELGKVFEPFYSRKPDGLGLGLAIALRVVEAHAGRIAAESEEGKGTKVIIALPVHGGEA
ncbi:MAG: ATP-binding protein [Candidatus Methylomirabilales bacterium]